MSAQPFRKKPVVIEAIQFNGANGAEFCDWMGSTSHEHFDADGYAFDPTTDVAEDGEQAEPRGTIEIRTLEGVMSAAVGDWIIRGVQGEFYPCKPDIFAATYEPAPSPSVPSPTTRETQ